MQYREVLHVTGGTYDKVTGLMDLRGTATETYSLLDQYDGTIPHEYFCPTGSWTTIEKVLRRSTTTAAGTYSTDSHRKVTMSSGSQGTMHVGHYPGSDPTSPNSESLPQANGTRYEQQSVTFGEDKGCSTPPAGCDPLEVTQCGANAATTYTTPYTNIDTPFPDFYTTTPPEVPVFLDRKGHLTGSSTFALTWGNEGVHRPPVPVTLTVAVDVYFGGGLIADAGGPYLTQRGDSVTLDASRSRTTDGVAIRTYQWAWAPDSQCLGAAPKNSPTPATATSSRSIVALCSLNLTLTVTDAKRRVATATTFVTVRKREGQFAATPVSHVSAYGVPAAAGGDTSPNVSGFLAGVNLPSCPNPPPAVIAEPWLCPAPTGSGSPTWLGGGYTLANVVDPGGPYDGYAWVYSTDLAIDRVGFINAYLSPGGPAPAGASQSFYDANAAGGYPIAAFLAAAQAHEGMGTATTPSGGHTGAASLAIARTEAVGPLDPRQRIEDQFDTNRANLQVLVDTLLADDDHSLCLATADPLPVIWSGTMLLWDAGALFPGWVPKLIRIGGDGAVACS